MASGRCHPFHTCKDDGRRAIIKNGQQVSAVHKRGLWAGQPARDGPILEGIPPKSQHPWGQGPITPHTGWSVRWRRCRSAIMHALFSSLLARPNGRRKAKRRPLPAVIKLRESDNPSWAMLANAHRHEIRVESTFIGGARWSGCCQNACESDRGFRYLFFNRDNNDSIAAIETWPSLWLSNYFESTVMHIKCRITLRYSPQFDSPSTSLFSQCSESLAVVQNC